MYLNAEVITIVNGSAITDAQHAFPLLAGYLYTNGIDSYGRNQLVGEVHSEVGGRETYFSTYLITTYYSTFEELVVTQIFLGGHDIAGKQGTTDSR